MTNGRKRDLQQSHLTTSRSKSNEQTKSHQYNTSTTRNLNNESRLLQYGSNFPSNRTTKLYLRHPNRYHRDNEVIDHGKSVNDENLVTSNIRDHLRTNGLYHEALNEERRRSMAKINVLTLRAPHPRDLHRLLTKGARHNNIRHRLRKFAIHPNRKRHRPKPRNVRLPTRRPRPPTTSIRPLPRTINRGHINDIRQLRGRVEKTNKTRRDRHVTRHNLINLRQ